MSDSLGRVVKIAGPVVDVAFAQDSLPEITNALEVDVEIDGSKSTIVLECSASWRRKSSCNFYARYRWFTKRC